MAIAPFLVLASVLSSLPISDAEVAAGRSEASRISVKFSTIPVVLGGEVNLTFHFPSNFSTKPAVSIDLFGYVYDGTSNKLLYTGTSQFQGNDSSAVIVRFPCEIFDHPGSYHFKYRISDGPIVSLDENMWLEWGKIQLNVPTNHTALTRFGYWIQHKRRCLSKNYRDGINLYYISDSKGKVVLLNKTVKKLRRNSKTTDQTRMTFKCNVLNVQGTYFIEYRSGYNNATLAESRNFYVHWGEHPLTSPQKTIHPCQNSLPLSFPRPECPRIGDTVQVYERGSQGPMITERHVLPGLASVFFPCRQFKKTFAGYCFHYVTKSHKMQISTTLSRLCIPSYKPGESMNEGWSKWSPWGMCTRSCGEGKQHRYRYCLSVTTSPQNAKNCQENSVQIRSCSLNPCPDNQRRCACGCQLTAREGMISSSPELFNRIGRKQCTWLINLQGNTRIRLWFDALKMDGDVIFVRDGNDSSAPLLATVKDGFSSSILSKRNSMYIFYSHNGKWKNGTKRGFTASYRAEVEEFTWKKKSLGTAEVTFLAVFIFSILILGIVLFVVFVKLRQQHCEPSTSSSGSSSTSETTIPSSPLDDEASSNEPLRGERPERTNGKPGRHKRRRRRSRRRNEYLCDVTMPRCSCAEVSGLESGSGSYSASDCNKSPMRTCMERTYAPSGVPPAHWCNCSQCLSHAQKCADHDKFGVPSKKYYGDWMVTEGVKESRDPRIYWSDSCTECRNSCEDFV